MNVSTGGGTLVHEIVHPFMAANFPACPAWFNEGLASLYEQSAERDGHIVGLTNWRLRGLQRAIRSGTVPSLKELLHTSDSEFYGPRSGIYYAQARYLCYYLQERGLLREFYRRFRAGCASDPTGYRTLKEVLGEDDMGAFQRRWEAFVLALRPTAVGGVRARPAVPVRRVQAGQGVGCLRQSCRARPTVAASRSNVAQRKGE